MHVLQYAIGNIHKALAIGETLTALPCSSHLYIDIHFLLFVREGGLHFEIKSDISEKNICRTACLYMYRPFHR